MLAFTKRGTNIHSVSTILKKDLFEVNYLNLDLLSLYQIIQSTGSIVFGSVVLDCFSWVPRQLLYIILAIYINTRVKNQAYWLVDVYVAMITIFIL